MVAYKNSNRTGQGSPRRWLPEKKVQGEEELEIAKCK